MNRSIVAISPVPMIISNVHTRANVYPTKKYVIILKIVQIVIALMVLRLMKDSKHANLAGRSMRRQVLHRFMLRASQPISFVAKPLNSVSIVPMFASKIFSFCRNPSEAHVIFSGDLDCLDSSDEENCEEIHPVVVPLSWHRDDTCMNGYRCAQGTLCLPLNELCDGISQCPLGDDEHPWRCRK